MKYKHLLQQLVVIILITDNGNKDDISQSPVNT